MNLFTNKRLVVKDLSYDLICIQAEGVVHCSPPSPSGRIRASFHYIVKDHARPVNDDRPLSRYPTRRAATTNIPWSVW